MYVSPLSPPMIPTLVVRPESARVVSALLSLMWRTLEPSTETATVWAVPFRSGFTKSTNGSVVVAPARGVDPFTTAVIVTSSVVESETVTVQLPLASVTQVLVPPPKAAEPLIVNWTVAPCAPTLSWVTFAVTVTAPDAFTRIGVESARLMAAAPATYWLKCGSAAVIVWFTVSTVDGSATGPFTGSR